MKTNHYKSHISLFFVCIMLLNLTACNFYRGTEKPINPPSPSQAVKETPSVYYVLHIGENIWQVNNLAFLDEGFQGTLSKVDENVLYYYMKIQNPDNNKKVKKDDLPYIYQTHIFANQFTKDGEQIKILNEDITKIEFYDRNNRKSAAATGGIIAGSILGGIGIFLAIACNCPHVYVNQDGTYYLNNTLFTGATSPVLERHDYKSMPDYNPTSDTYSFIIQNEDNEDQYTNLLELVVINHPKNTEVYATQTGELYTTHSSENLLSAKDNNGNDLTHLIKYKDDDGHSFNVNTIDTYNNAFLSFTKPENVENAKLILNVKNNLWSAYVYKEFAALFGKHYDNWVDKNRKKELSEVKAAMKMTGIPMIVWMKAGEEWKEIEVLELIGDINYNGLVIPIPSNEIQGETIEFKIQSGFMFWNLDYAAMDFSEQGEIDVEYIKPSIVQNTTNDQLVDKLSLDDDLYMHHGVNSDSVTVTFNGLTAAKSNRTIILHSKGYYIPLEQYEGKADKEALEKMRNEGEMSRFSKELFDQKFNGVTLNIK